MALSNASLGPGETGLRGLPALEEEAYSRCLSSNSLGVVQPITEVLTRVLHLPPALPHNVVTAAGLELALSKPTHPRAL